MRQFWQGMPATNRVMLIAVSIAVVVLSIGFVVWAGSEEYVTLIRDPAPGDLQSIRSYLKDQKVAYRVSDDGKSIDVPASKQPELQMGLAAANLMNGSSSLGYRLLDKTNAMMTDRMEDLTIRRALEGHVEQAIESLEPVASATIQFVPGTDSPFVSEKRGSTAMVVVHTKSGRELDGNNVKAIVNLTARAFPGMDAKSVSLVNGAGELLWDGARAGAGTGDTGERFSLERQYQERLTHDIRSHIERVAGPGKCSVVVRASLNLDNETQTTREVLQGARVATTESTEKLAGAGRVGGPRPAAGVAANGGAGVATPPTYQAGEVNSPQGEYSSTQSQQTFSPGSKETTTVRAPGRLQSLSVAVLLDDSVGPAAVDAIRRDVDALVPMPDAETAGMDRRVSVDSVPFDRSMADARKKEDASAAAAERTGQWLSFGVPIAVMLLMLFVLARSLRRVARPTMLALPGQMAYAGAAAGAGTGQMASAGAGTAGASLNLVVGEGAASVATQSQPTAAQVEAAAVSALDDMAGFELPQDGDANSIARLARARPDMVAALLRGWMTEDR